MISRSFYFLRHGETDANVQKIFQGHGDNPLNANGRAQAQAAAEILRHYSINRIISSPLQRALETAEIINAVLQKPLSCEDALKERDFGLYEGKSVSWVMQWEKDNLPRDALIEIETGYPAPPDGEIYGDFQARVIDGVIRNLARYPDETILFVGHGKVFGALHHTLFQADLYSNNAQPYHFDYADDKWMLHRLAPAIESH